MTTPRSPRTEAGPDDAALVAFLDDLYQRGVDTAPEIKDALDRAGYRIVVAEAAAPPFVCPKCGKTQAQHESPNETYAAAAAPRSTAMMGTSKRDDYFYRQGVRAGRILGNRDARFMEATVRSALDIIRFAHHDHAFGDEFCTPANCSVADWLDTHTDTKAQVPA